MGEVVDYVNNTRACFCRIRLENGEQILISIANRPRPCVQILKNILFGLLPIRTVWEYTATQAGGNEQFIRNLTRMFCPETAFEHVQPLDAIRDFVIACHSIVEVRDRLSRAERSLMKDVPPTLSDTSIIAAFAAVVVQSRSDKIFDARRLPTSKDAISQALRRQIDHFESATKGDPNNELLLKRLEGMRCLLTNLADFQ